MSEQEWLTSTDPAAMLSQIIGELTYADLSLPSRQSLSNRKLRLFACAILRLRGPLYETVNELNTRIDGYEMKGHRVAAQWAKNWVRESAIANEVKAALLRDIFGNPWQPRPCRCDPDVGVFNCEWCDEYWNWKRWNNGAIPKLAQIMYNSRDFSDMPKLGDMLEEAGCEDTTILYHCRGMQIKDGRCCCDCGTPCPLGKAGMELKCTIEELSAAGVGKHVRGCWVIDLLFGKS